MPRKPLFLTDTHPYHITVRSNNKDWFEHPIDDCFDIFMRNLKKTQDRYHTEIHLFILMSNHIHLLGSTPLMNISAAQRYFLTESSRELRKGTRRINHIFGGRYRWSVVQSEIYYFNAFKYLLRNPVVAGMCETVEEHPWSTFEVVRPNPIVKITKPNGHHALIPENKADLLAWLNTPTSGEFDEAVRKGLKRSTFEMSRVDRKKKKSIDPYEDFKLLTSRNTEK